MKFAYWAGDEFYTSWSAADIETLRANAGNEGKMEDVISIARLIRIFSLEELRKMRDEALDKWDSLRVSNSAQSTYFHDLAIIYADAIYALKKQKKT